MLSLINISNCVLFSRGLIIPGCEALIIILNLLVYLWNRNASRIQFNHLGEFCLPVIFRIGHIVVDNNGRLGQATAPGPAFKGPHEKNMAEVKTGRSMS
jgi:hypothetical protein